MTAIVSPPLRDAYTQMKLLQSGSVGAAAASDRNGHEKRAIDRVKVDPLLAANGDVTAATPAWPMLATEAAVATAFDMRKRFTFVATSPPPAAVVLVANETAEDAMGLGDTGRAESFVASSEVRDDSSRSIHAEKDVVEGSSDKGGNVGVVTMSVDTNEEAFTIVGCGPGRHRGDVGCRRYSVGHRTRAAACVGPSRPYYFETLPPPHQHRTVIGVPAQTQRGS